MHQNNSFGKNMLSLKFNHQRSEVAVQLPLHDVCITSFPVSFNQQSVLMSFILIAKNYSIKISI